MYTPRTHSFLSQTTELGKVLSSNVLSLLP
jgi:hypothetical protein